MKLGNYFKHKLNVFVKKIIDSHNFLLDCYYKGCSNGLKFKKNSEQSKNNLVVSQTLGFSTPLPVSRISRVKASFKQTNQTLKLKNLQKIFHPFLLFYKQLLLQKILLMPFFACF